MLPLIIGDVERAELLSLKEYAELHPLSLDDMLDIINGSEKPPGDKLEFNRVIPMGYRVVYTIEQHPKAKYKHLSMSPLASGAGLTEFHVQMIMDELGFITPFEECKVYLENEEAINVLEPY